MGYFGCAYIVEGSADETGVTLTTTVLTPALDHGRALFFWSEGERPPGLFSYANDSLRCTSHLTALPGYPVTEHRGNQSGESENLVLIEEDFRAQSPDEPVIFHFLLPSRFVPCPDRQPLLTPSRPSVIARDERLSVTFVATGAADVRFWIRRLDPNEKLADFDLTRLYDKPAERTARATLEINLGIVKFTFGER
jgi:hypothetical protein